MKFKANNWLDLNTREISYGIDIFYNGQWHHISAGGEPLFFATAAERDTRLKELRKDSLLKQCGESK